MIPRMSTLADRLLPDALWQRIQLLLPPPPSHARGGAPRTVPDRACMAAIIFMARTSLRGRCCGSASSAAAA
jgi:transposase